MDKIKNVAQRLGIITVEDMERYTALELIMMIANKVNDQNVIIQVLFDKGLISEVEQIFNEWTQDGTFDTLINQSALKEVSDRVDKTNAQLTQIVHLASDFGVIADGVTDNTNAIQSMIDKLDSGSKIQFPNGLIKITGDIDFKGKEFNVLVGLNTEFVGYGQMPPMLNHNHKVTGNYLKLAPSNGKKYQGDSAISAEIQPTSTYQGNGVAIYGGAMGGKMDGELWGANILLDILNGYTGNGWGLEIDVNNHTTHDNGKEIVGLDITGDGTTDVDRGLAIRRASQKWKKAMTLEDFIEGLEIKGDENLVILKPSEKSEKAALYLAPNNELVMMLKNNGHLQTTIVEGTQYITSAIVQANNQLLPPSTNNTKIANVVRHELTTTVNVKALETIQVDLACAGARIGDNVNETIISASPLGLFTQAQIAENDKVRITLYNSTNSGFTDQTLVFDVVCYKFIN